MHTELMIVVSGKERSTGTGRGIQKGTSVVSVRLYLILKHFEQMRYSYQYFNH